MARIKIKLPEKFDFSTEMPIRACEINQGNHLAATAILPIAMEAQLLYMEHLGVMKLDTRGDGFITADTAIVFKSQAFYGQTLKIEVCPADLGRKTCDFICRITCKETGDEIALVKIGAAFFSYKTQKLIDVPAEFRKLFPE